MEGMTCKIHKKKNMVFSFTVIFAFLCTVLFINLIVPTIESEPPFSANHKVNSGPDAARYRPSLAVASDGTVYAAWEDLRNGNWDIYITKSIDDGDSWVAPDVPLSSGPGNQTYPSIVVDSQGTIHAVWQDDRNGDKDIYYANSTDFGLTWSPSNIRVSTDTISVGSPNRSQEVPKIAVDSADVLYVVWQDARWNDNDIYFAKSTDSGATWTDPNRRVNRDPAPSPDQNNPAIAVDVSGNLFVVWDEDDGTENDIYFSKSVNGGDDWSDPHIMVNTDAENENQEKPTIDVDSEGNIYVAWTDRRNAVDNDIYFAASFNGGANWSNPNVRVDDSVSGRQSNPQLIVSNSGTIYVVWHDDRNTHNDIYSAYSINKGANWSKPDINVIDDTLGMTQRFPAIAIGHTGPVFVAWQDSRNTSNDIYSAHLDSIHPYPIADGLSVEGFFGGTPEIRHILNHEPEFGFTYIDPNSASLSQYNVSLWDESGLVPLWFCNTTDSSPSDSEITVIYNTAPCPENGPLLLDGTSYILRVAVANVSGIWSPDFEVQFHLNEVLVPGLPITPSDNAQLEAQQYQTVTWSSPGVDSDGDTPVSFTWEVASDSGFSSIIDSGSGLVHESNPFDTRPSGTYYWRVSLSDGWENGGFGNLPDGYWDFTTFTSSGQNNPPSITNKADVPTTTKVNSTLLFTFNATDPDSDPLSWSKTQGPSWLDIGSSNGTIYGHPEIEEIGSSIFTIQVNDGRGGFDNHTFTINVSQDSNGNGDGEDNGDDNGDPDPQFPWFVILIIIIIIILFILFFLFYRRKRDEDDEDEEKVEPDNEQD
jgi:hypothetical protein